MSLSTNPPNNREARLTALLLGELSDDEAAALRQEIARDPELAKLHERLSRTVGLVREAATSVDEVIVPEPAPLKLSSSRRETLLKSFKVVRPAHFAPWYRRVGVPRELVALAAMIMILAMLAAFVMVTRRERAAVANASDYNGDSHARIESWKAVGERQTITVSDQPLNGQARPQDLRVSELSAAGDSANRKSTEAEALVQQGRRLYESGKLEEAEAQLKRAREGDPSSRAAYYYSDRIREQKHKDETAGREERSKEKLKNIDSEWLQARPEVLKTADADYLAKSSESISLPLSAAAPSDKLDLFADIARQKQVSNTPNGAQDRGWNLPAGSSASAGVPAATAPPPVSGPAQQAGTSRLGDVGGVALQMEARKPQKSDTRQLDRLSQVGGGFGGGGGAGGAENTSGVKADTSLGYVVETAIPHDAKIPKSGWLEDGTWAAMGRPPAVPQTPPPLPKITTALDLTPVPGRIEVLRTNGSISSVALNSAAGDSSAGTHVAGTIFTTNDVPRRYDMAQRDLESTQKLEANGIYSVNAVGYVNVTNAAIDRSALAGESLVINETMFNPPTAPPAARNFRVVLPELGEAEKKDVAEKQLGLGQAGKSLAQTAAQPPVVDPATGLPVTKEVERLSSKSELDERPVMMAGGSIVRSSSPEKLERIKTIRIEEEARYERLNALYNSLTNLTTEELKKALATASPDPVLADLFAGVAKAEQRLAERLETHGPNHPEVQAAKQELADENTRLRNRYEVILEGLKTRTQSAKASLESLEKEIDAAKKTSPTSTAPISQPEIYTADNAFSTFSLNVSDVSFKLAEASLQKGALPEAATIRSEEFINAFDYRDPEAAPGKPIAFAWDRARSPFAHNRDLLRFSIKTSATGRHAGKPVNLVLLLDNSGSMERADRVRIIQECLRALAAQLNPEDRVSVVSFARTPRLWVDGLAGSQAAELPQRVGSLTPQGGTNLEEGMNLAYQTARRHFVAHGINRVVVLTDGAANLGDVEPQSLKQQIETHRKQGIALDCFGIGWEGYNDDLLEQLSRNGDGRYGFVNTPEAAATEFAGQLVGALQVAASDVKVQVEFNPKRVTSYRQIGYAKHQLQKEQFRDNTVDAAEIAAAEAGNALYAVQVNPRGEGPLAVVRVRYKTPGTSEYYEHEWSVPFSGSVPPLEEATAAIRLAGVAASFAEWLAASPYAAEVKPDALLRYLSGVPDAYGADPRPRKLETMIRQSIALAGSR
jgi:Mg-chelatase subunit ChlD/anti-sigma factor RsiW